MFSDILKDVLYSFVYAMAVEESRFERINTRYLSVIDGKVDLTAPSHPDHDY